MIIGEDIIKKVRSGDRRAFRVLVEKFQQYAFNIAFRILCDEDEAKDAVQEGFIKIWQRINDFDGNSKFSTWMYRIVTNKAIDRLRSINRENLISIDSVIEKYGIQSEEDPGRNMDNREMGRLIQVISEDLPEKQRLVFIMRDLQGMDSADVQEILGLSETAVKSNLYHGRQAVKQKLTRLIQYERRRS
jgi:RNA polymerase sigma-70 factor (ECF subfamily)